MKVKIKVKQYRIMRGLNCTELANKVGVSQVFISDIEAGNKIPSVAVLCRIAKALNIKPGDLIDYE